MKIQIDTNNKIIKLEESIKLDILLNELEKLLPNWKEYTLEVNTTIYWADPVVPVYPQYPYWPWWEPVTISDNTGTYNLELNENTC
jgi:hypothetical protein